MRIERARTARKTSQKTGFGQGLVLILVALVVTNCSGRKVDESAPSETSGDQKVESLTNALSRAQSRIEELDAKVSALTDKLESTRLTVDNIAGTKPLKTEAVGSIAGIDSEDIDDSQKPLPKEQSADAKALLKQDSAISDFNKAMALFKAAKYTDAELAFNHFTETYPEHVLAGSAQFYAGESYYYMGEYKLALNEYGKVVASFSTSPRVASAMVRMSHCYEAIGNSGEATRTMALARDVFDGNPSLDWLTSPKKKTDAPATKPAEKADAPKELNASPIEPNGDDDTQIDNLDEKDNGQ